MKYLIYLLQCFELLLVLMIWIGGEYAEGIIVPFMVVLVLYIIFLSLNKHYKKNRKFVGISTKLIIASASLTTFYVLFRGPIYFEETWKGMTQQEYTTMIMLLCTIIVLQVSKLLLVKEDKD